MTTAQTRQTNVGQQPGAPTSRGADVTAAIKAGLNSIHNTFDFDGELRSKITGKSDNDYEWHALDVLGPRALIRAFCEKRTYQEVREGDVLTLIGSTGRQGYTPVLQVFKAIPWVPDPADMKDFDPNADELTKAMAAFTLMRNEFRFDGLIRKIEDNTWDNGKTKNVGVEGKGAMHEFRIPASQLKNGVGELVTVRGSVANGEDKKILLSARSVTDHESKKHAK